MTSLYTTALQSRPKEKVYAPALRPLRSHAADCRGSRFPSPCRSRKRRCPLATGKRETGSCGQQPGHEQPGAGSTHGRLRPREANAKHESLTSPWQRCSSRTRAPGGTNKQTRRRREGGQGTLRILGRFYLPASALKLPHPNTTAAVEELGTLSRRGGLYLFQPPDLEGKVDLIKARPCET